MFFQAVQPSEMNHRVGNNVWAHPELDVEKLSHLQTLRILFTFRWLSQEVVDILAEMDALSESKSWRIVVGEACMRSKKSNGMRTQWQQYMSASYVEQAYKVSMQRKTLCQWYYF